MLPHAAAASQSSLQFLTLSSPVVVQNSILDAMLRRLRDTPVVDCYNNYYPIVITTPPFAAEMLTLCETHVQ